MEGVPASKGGTVSHGLWCSRTPPPGLQRLGTLEEPGLGVAPGPRKERKRLLTAGQVAGREIVFDGNGAGGREICRTQEIYSYLYRLGREATKAPPSSKKK